MYTHTYKLNNANKSLNKLANSYVIWGIHSDKTQ